MKVTRAAFTVTLQDVAPAIAPPRTPGLHVSDITTAILAELAPDVYAKDYHPADSANWQQTGFLWETIIGAALGQHAVSAPDQTRFRPGELTKDGIICSPDSVLIEPDGGLVNEEFKATWKSATHFDLESLKYLYWQLQFKAYAHVLGTRRSRLFVLFLNGDYNRYVPELRRYEIEWTADELETCWAMLKNTARKKGWL